MMSTSEVDVDVNGVRTQEIKRMKLTTRTTLLSSTDPNRNDTSNGNGGLEKSSHDDDEEEEEENGSKGDISLVVQALEPSPFQLDGDPKVGLCLLAKRDLKAGELLFDDTPAFYGPSADLVQDYSTPLCLGCCVVMNDGNEGSRCPTCAWPICGPDCENMEIHVSNECQLFSKEGVKFPPEDVEIQPCYKAIAIIRGLLLKERDPRLWEQLKNLQWETQLRLTPQPDIPQLKEQFGLEDFGDDADWHRILGIINVNSYSFQRVERKAGSPSFGECLFPIYSLMCHSCRPNCTWAITYSPSFTMKVRPTVDIRAGQMLTVCYNHEFSKFGHLHRQERIRERAEFACSCERCGDPSDLGTKLAAVHCFKCKEGLMLPTRKNAVVVDDDDAEEEEEEDWKCDNCGYSMCPSFISSFVESLYEQLGCAEDEAEEAGVTVVKILEDFMEANSGVKVHSNHWVIAEAAYAIVGLQSKDYSKLGMEEVEKFLKLVEFLLRVRSVLAPGLSNERGMLHHYLARGLYRKLELLRDSSDEDECQVEEEMKKLAGVQVAAVRFWKDNPHYDTLIASYKREPELLMKEAELIASKLKTFLSQKNKMIVE